MPRQKVSPWECMMLVSQVIFQVYITYWRRRLLEWSA